MIEYIKTWGVVLTASAPLPVMRISRPRGGFSTSSAAAACSLFLGSMVRALMVDGRFAIAGECIQKDNSRAMCRIAGTLRK